MAHNGQEIEAKFYILHLDKVRTRLHQLEARLIQERVLETNLRFDRPDGGLRSKGEVLRLRHDTESRITYKGAGQSSDGILSREEIEFVVGDFEKAQKFLQALGYQPSLYYEKYRTTYELDRTLVMLDELPFGNFVEIEGEDVEQIHGIAERLNIRWSAAIESSYAALFENIQRVLRLPFDEISFRKFEGMIVTTDDLRVAAADE
jgi:adenylate cyclase class 2